MLRTFSVLRKGLAAARMPVHQKIIYKYQILRPSSRYFSSDVAAVWPKEITDFLAKERITEPTKIQKETLKFALDNKDLVGIARTGSGKTLAFVIPAIMKILEERKTSSGSVKKPVCLVLEPTRELANQTADVFKKFRHLDIKSIVLVGGASRSAQIQSLSDVEFDVYIATPGRLTDLSESDIIDLSGVKYLVLDEADRMLDMGFEPQVRKIVQSIPHERQTLMWSATWPKEIQELASDFMTDFNYVAVDSQELKANPNIIQKVQVCKNQDKLNLLLDQIDEIKQTNQNSRFLIFCNTKRRADQLLLQLSRNRLRAISMHGDKSQAQRDRALALFKQQQCNIMIATDVAARGLDINDITHVFNFDMPNTIEDYVHRIGRTARHDKSGTAISFVTDDDARLSSKLIHTLKQTNQEVPNELQAMRDDDLSSTSDTRLSNNRRNFSFTNRGFGGNRRFDNRGFGNREFDNQNSYNNRGSYGSRTTFGDRGYNQRDTFRDRKRMFGDE